MLNYNILKDTLFLYACRNYTRSNKFYKQYRGHHGRGDELFGACERSGLYSFCVQISIHSEISLHVFGIVPKLGVSQLCMEPILWRACRKDWPWVGLYNLLSIVWVGWIFTICHRMRAQICSSVPWLSCEKALYWLYNVYIQYSKR
jgi:hypothetical protein